VWYERVNVNGAEAEAVHVNVRAHCTKSAHARESWRGMKSLDELAEIADELPTNYLRCRLWGHTWPQKNERSEVVDLNTMKFTCVCDSCEAEKFRNVTVLGSLLQSGLIYPEGYVLLGVGHLTTAERDVIRAAYVRRVLERSY
jgi:hypothetical protein